MANYAVLGLGMMGKAICFDILQHDKEAIVYGYEINQARSQEVKEELKKFSHRFVTVEFNLDDSQPAEASDLLKSFKKQQINVVFGAIDYRYNVYLSKVCIEARAHFLDLGGNPDIVNQQRALDNLSKSSDVTIIPDCGLAPGMANVLAASLMDEFETLEYCKIRVGGLPKDPKTILNYQQVFSIRGLTNEYLEDAEVIRDGAIRTVSSLTEIEKINFELFNYNEFEAFQTAGGTSSLPQLFEGKIKKLDYKTIRYKGHAQFIQFLKEFELLSSEPYKNTDINPREVIEYYLQKHLPKKQARFSTC